MKIDFYYWAAQCPINYETIQLLNSLDQNQYEVALFDITDQEHLAKKMKLFFPSLIVINEKIRWRSPINPELITQFKRGEKIEENPYLVRLPEKEFQGRVVKLTDQTIKAVRSCCTINGSAEACQVKGSFLNKVAPGFYGYLHYRGEQLVGGAEFVPSMQVPYPIPKDPQTAFLTCSYLSSGSDQDNRAYPLRVLEQELAGNYRQILAITDEQGVFPNGNLAWFIRQGYRDEGIVSVEEAYATLHLVSKAL